jgi:uncharacterized protein YbaR (Trm112 family)
MSCCPQTHGQLLLKTEKTDDVSEYILCVDSSPAGYPIAGVILQYLMATIENPKSKIVGLNASLVSYIPTAEHSQSFINAYRASTGATRLAPQAVPQWPTWR